MLARQSETLLTATGPVFYSVDEPERGGRAVRETAAYSHAVDFSHVVVVVIRFLLTAGYGR